MPQNTPIRKPLGETQLPTYQNFPPKTLRFHRNLNFNAVINLTKRIQTVFLLPAIRMQYNRYGNSIANLSLFQAHSFHGKLLREHRISGSRQENRSSSFQCFPIQHKTKLKMLEMAKLFYDISHKTMHFGGFKHIF